MAKAKAPTRVELGSEYVDRARPSSSMAHEEKWFGPFHDYMTAEGAIVGHLSAGEFYASGHVCKRIVKANEE